MIEELVIDEAMVDEVEDYYKTKKIKFQKGQKQREQ